MTCYWKKKSTGAQKELRLQLLVSLTKSTGFSCRSCILNPGVHFLPGSGIVSLFITKCLVTNISGEQNIENSHKRIQTRWAESSTHPYSNTFSAGFRFDCWFSTDLWFLLRHPRGETVCLRGCICSLLKNKNPCQVNRNQWRELLIWQWIECLE